MTGVLDRLERAGFIGRERSRNDRRAVVVHAGPDRLSEAYGMNGEMDGICADYTTAELQVLADFCSAALTRAVAPPADS